MDPTSITVCELDSFIGTSAALCSVTASVAFRHCLKLIYKPKIVRDNPECDPDVAIRSLKC
jgi:P pilus assembly chaperone PapD